MTREQFEEFYELAKMVGRIMISKPRVPSNAEYETLKERFVKDEERHDP